jgi:hypothetical protein
MPAPAAELKRAVFAALGKDAALTERVGGRILDQSSANTVFPSVTFGRTSLYDWGSGAERSDEQLFTLHVWSKAGETEIGEIMAILRSLMDGMTLDLGDGCTAAARLEFSEARHHEELQLHTGLLRFRAVAE